MIKCPRAMIEYQPRELSNYERSNFFFKHGVTPEMADVYRTQCVKAFNFLSLILYEDYVNQDLVYQKVNNPALCYTYITMIDLNQNPDQLYNPQSLKDATAETLCAYCIVLIDHLETKHQLRFVSQIEDVDRTCLE